MPRNAPACGGGGRRSTLGLRSTLAAVWHNPSPGGPRDFRRRRIALAMAPIGELLPLQFASIESELAAGSPSPTSQRPPRFFSPVEHVGTASKDWPGQASDGAASGGRPINAIEGRCWVNSSHVESDLVPSRAQKGSIVMRKQRYVADKPHFVTCFLCRVPFQFGPNIYAGQRVPPWDIMVCEPCTRGNWDGIVLATHHHLAKHLRNKGIPIRLNAKGWLDWPGSS